MTAPFEGLKVLDLAWVVAGPVIGRMLADYGATVVRVESSLRAELLYFERTMQERLFLTFADLLAPDGILILGKVETLFGPARDRLVLVDARERIYRRPA